MTRDPSGFLKRKTRRSALGEPRVGEFDLVVRLMTPSARRAEPRGPKLGCVEGDLSPRRAHLGQDESGIASALAGQWESVRGRAGEIEQEDLGDEFGRKPFMRCYGHQADSPMMGGV